MPYKPEPKLVRCPFNPMHIFTRDRLQPHIIKCSRNYPNHYTCPFFNLHKFLSEEERNVHVFTCDRKMLSQPWLYVPPETRRMHQRPVYNLDLPECGENDEDWEKEYQRN